MGRVYTISFAGVSVAAQQDLFSLKPATDKPIKIHGIYLAQSTEVGDAAEEMLLVRIIRGHATIGSGGSNPTPRPQDAGDNASGITTNSRVNDTTIASAGSPVNLHSDAFNVRTGWLYLPTPEMRPRCSETDGFIVVRLLTTPADSITMTGTLYFEEL